MIKSLTNKKIWMYKENWIDQNNKVVGFDCSQQCCESFGWDVFNKETRKLVSDDPSGLPYHFGDSYEYSHFGQYHNDDVFECEECQDVFQVELLPDDKKSPILVLEFYNGHNGYYYHDFSMITIDESKAKEYRNDD